MISRVVLDEIPLNWPTLKYVKPGGAKKPKDDIDKVRPPSNAKPFLIDEKDASIEKQQGKLDERECRSSENHHYPDMLYDVREFLTLKSPVHDGSP